MNRRGLLLGAAALAVGGARAARAEASNTFHLRGGVFYGPGPIKPDTVLPDGEVRGVRFDRAQWRGVAAFRPGPTPLSDGVTHVNANIDAGRFGIGEGSRAKTFWLTAVDGGPNGGTETYTLDAERNFVWQVDLALDPGFVEGIIRVDGFRLTTGWVQVHPSLQTSQSAPGGYDRAGSLPSGSVLLGRVGDFDRDGFLDGILVAAANVPLAADMLPGAPVGNRRGFVSDIPVDPLMAAGLALAGVANLRPLVERLMQGGATAPAMLVGGEAAGPTVTGGEGAALPAVLAEIGLRIEAAARNCEDAFLKADRAGKHDIQDVRTRIATTRQLFYIPWAFLAGYKQPAGPPAATVRECTQRGFAALEDSTARLRALETR